MGITTVPQPQHSNCWHSDPNFDLHDLTLPPVGYTTTQSTTKLEPIRKPEKYFPGLGNCTKEFIFSSQFFFFFLSLVT